MMSGPALRIFGAAALASLQVLAAGCTDAKLEPVPAPAAQRADNKLSVSGSFCTTDPDDLDFPVKILFMIDGSSSMAVTDPDLTRLGAVLDVIDVTLGVPGVEIGIILFGTGSLILTEHCDDYVTRTNCFSGFAPPDEALKVVGQIAQTGGTTDFILTLQTAIGMLATDMALQEPDDLQNARYVLMFLSDGLPDADSRFDPQQTCRDAVTWEQQGRAPPNAVDVVEQADLLMGQMVELARQFDVRELSFNSAFAATPDTATEIKACGSAFMRAMAKRGNGVFRDFSSGEAINFLFVDFTSFKRVFAMKNFTATNLNARPFSAALGVDPRVRADDPTLARGIIDSDGDGLSDELEDLIGTDRFLQDTDNDGFSDLLEHNLRDSGFDPLDPTDADCKGDNDRLDTDGDGLRDCEELFVGTLARVYDSDNDGFGDGIEVLYGSNPGLADTLLDIDFDGVGNAAEMRAHSRVDTDDVVELSEHAYRYRIREIGLEGSQLCYDFVVDNIALASTAGAADLPPAPNGSPVAPGLGGGALLPFENRILFEVTESPFDAPGEPGVARLACARARFDAERRLKEPANGRLTLPREAFKPATQFNPALDCIDP
jgi:hypothetical protein